MSDKKVFIHINLPRDILRKAAAKENFKETFKGNIPSPPGVPTAAPGAWY